MEIDYKDTLDSLKNTRDMWSSLASSVVSEQIYKIALITAFYDAWANGQNPWDTLPEDNPSTPSDEGITPNDFTNIATEYFNEGSSLPSDTVPTLTPELVEKLESDLGNLQGKLRYYYAQKSAFENMMSVTDMEIDDIEALQKNAPSEEE